MKCSTDQTAQQTPLEKKLKLEGSQPNTGTSEELQRAGGVKQKMRRKHPADFVLLAKGMP